MLSSPTRLLLLELQPGHRGAVDLVGTVREAQGAGVSDDFPLAYSWASARTLRLADGPDEVHRAAVARLELKKERHAGQSTDE